MTKADEVADPESCLNKAADGEMLFVVLARDPAAAATVRFWVRERVRLGVNSPGDLKLLNALGCADVMENQRARLEGERRPE